MPSESFPVGRVIFMMIWPITRPIVGALRNSARRSRLFRDYICIPVARVYHRMADKVKQWEDGTDLEYKRLDAEKAVQIGTNLLGEAIFFGISASLVTLEYMRYRKKRQAQMLTQSSDLLLSDTIVRNMFFLSEKRNVMIRMLRRDVKSLEKKIENMEKSRPHFDFFKKLPKLSRVTEKLSFTPTHSFVTQAINYVQNDVMQL